MVDFPSAVAVPPTSAYGPGLADFSALANAPNTYYQGIFNRQQQQLNAQKLAAGQRQQQLAQAFPNGLPTDPRTGAIDYGAVAQTLARFGDVGDAMSVMQQQPVPQSPMFGGPPQAAPPQGAPTAAPTAASPSPQPQSPAPVAGPSGGTVAAIASSVAAPDTVARNVARAVGVDPTAPLSDEQRARASSLLHGYATRQSGAGLERLQSAIFGQESNSGRNTQTSVTGARGGMQIQPDTFKQYASAGENIDNPADNQAVGNRILQDYWKRYNGDPARAAVAYFSGPGNVAPAGSPTPWKTDKADPTGKTTSSYVNDVLRKMGVGQLREAMTPANARVGQGFGQIPSSGGGSATAGGSGLPPSANAGTPAPRAGGGAAPSGPAVTAGGAPPVAAGAPSGVPGGVPVGAPVQQQPLTPQESLPQGFTDPVQAIQALRTEAARYAGMGSRPGAQTQAQRLDAWADRIEKSIKPLSVGAAATVVDPRTGKVLFQGAAANTKDIALRRYLDEHPDATAEDIQKFVAQGRPARSAAAMSLQRFLEENPNASAEDIQNFNAAQVGKSTAERTRAGREENLNLILKAADAAIPAALEASKNLPRGSYVPLNRLIQKGEIMSSDPRLVEFGMANLQLAEHWARAMNPTGVMRESDRDKALSFLDMAYSNGTYERAVMQLQKQITRERDAVHGGGTTIRADKAPEPGGADKDGWVAAPNGALIREKKGD